MKNLMHKYWVRTIENGETKAQIPSNYITCPDFFLDRWRGWLNETWSWTKMVPRSFSKSISVCKSLKAFPLSPIDIATGALNNRISSVYDGEKTSVYRIQLRETTPSSIGCHMDRCLHHQGANLKIQGDKGANVFNNKNDKEWNEQQSWQ